MSICTGQQNTDDGRVLCQERCVHSMAGNNILGMMQQRGRKIAGDIDRHAKGKTVQYNRRCVLLSSADSLTLYSSVNGNVMLHVLLLLFKTPSLLPHPTGCIHSLMFHRFGAVSEWALGFVFKERPRIL